MLHLTIHEWEKLASNPDLWEFTHHSDYIDEYYNDDDFDFDDGCIHPQKEVLAAAVVTARYKEVLITYSENFSYVKGVPDSLDESGLMGEFFIEGVKVTGEFGDLEKFEMRQYLESPFCAPNFDLIHQQIFTNSEGVKEIDMASDMKEFEIIVDGSKDIRFTGKEIASVSSNSPTRTYRYTVLALYQTASGKYICHQIGRSHYDDERSRYSASVCESLDEVRDFFGQGWLAKELYNEAKIDNTITVD